MKPNPDDPATTVHHPHTLNAANILPRLAAAVTGLAAALADALTDNDCAKLKSPLRKNGVGWGSGDGQDAAK